MYKLSLILVLFSFFISKLPNNYLELTAIDVGQGDSFLIQTTNKRNILIDGGGDETGNYDVGSNVLLPYLLNRYVLKLDLIIISHSHADHIDGIYTVIENLKVEKVIIGPYLSDDEKIKKLYELCDKKKIEVIKVSKGDVIKIDDVRFEVLYPQKNQIDENINNLSLVMKMFFRGRSVLFTGDIEANVEGNISKNLKADILKVAHHGSKTSSSAEFINQVKPEIALIGVGKKNTFGHPNKAVIDRLKNFAKVYMTKDSRRNKHKNL